MQSLQKIILKARKLYRMSKENSYEGEIALKYLNKLKRKHGLKDSMIFPIYKKEIYSHDKNDYLSSCKEILIFKIGQLCGNTVLSDETIDTFILSFKGNDITIENATKIIDYIDKFTDDMTKKIMTSNLPATKEQIILDAESIKVGLIIKITNLITSEIEKVELVLEKGDEETNNPKSSYSAAASEHESNVELKRQKYEHDAVIMAANLIDEFHVIPVINYVKDIISN